MKRRELCDYSITQTHRLVLISGGQGQGVHFLKICLFSLCDSRSGGRAQGWLLDTLTHACTQYPSSILDSIESTDYLIFFKVPFLQNVLRRSNSLGLPITLNSVTVYLPPWNQMPNVQRGRICYPKLVVWAVGKGLPSSAFQWTGANQICPASLSRLTRKINREICKTVIERNKRGRGACWKLVSRKRGGSYEKWVSERGRLKLWDHLPIQCATTTPQPPLHLKTAFITNRCFQGAIFSVKITVIICTGKCWRYVIYNNCIKKVPIVALFYKWGN